MTNFKLGRLVMTRGVNDLVADNTALPTLSSLALHDT